MKGDFSRWRYQRGDNFQGILPQQGRVLLDSDGVAQTAILNDWEQVAAEDVIGTGVAAVPAALPDSFKVVSASVTAGVVTVGIDPGRVWADGLLVHLPPEIPGAPPVKRTATYLEPPIQAPQPPPAAGLRDAVILEVWRESMNAFQRPDVLLEPALGGPDTAERVHIASALRLYRMGPNDTCGNLPIADDFSKKGKLTVTLQPTVTVPGDCPVVETGGYTGFEHQLYRIEVADVSPGSAPQFKWSRFNGGLVGLGIFSAGPDGAIITANLSAINTCGLSSFYLEAEEFNPDRGVWEVIYGAQATLNNSNQLVLLPPVFGTLPASPPPPADPRVVFFRLWDGIKPISSFTASTLLEDGIYLQFDLPAAANYSPRDYWTFQVRAGGIANPLTLIDTKPPEGIHHHRVPLGVITWPASLNAGTADISDCREPFQPLTRISSCCTYRVGDGVNSFGDFTSVQAAVDALPSSGGEICVLAGTYTENVLIRKSNVRVHGCGWRSKIVAPEPAKGGTANPAIHVQDCHHVHLDSLAVMGPNAAPAILLDASAAVLAANAASPGVYEIHLTHLFVTGQTRSAIEARDGAFIEIRDCRIRMANVAGSWPAIFFQADDGLIQGNEIRALFGQQTLVSSTFLSKTGSTVTLGGIQIGGTSDRVRIINNLIQGGIGNGITLGSVIVQDANGNDTGTLVGWVINPDDPCSPCRPGSTVYPPGGDTPGTKTVSAGPLTEIRIERNRIFDMGLNGISVVAFFDPGTSGEIIDVQGLEILGNHIRGCLQRQLDIIPSKMLLAAGYGGIALASVEKLVIRDNVIEDNGPRWTDPVCGVFVLLVRGAEIARNRIANNGAWTSEPSSSARQGARGGIFIIAAVLEVEGSGAALFATVKLGGPALRIEENTVIAPLGRALTVSAALGAVAVADNLLVSQGILPFDVDLSGFLFTTVFIANLGVDYDLVSGSYSSLKMHTYDTQSAYTTYSAAPAHRYFANGLIQFSDNQVILDIEDVAGSIAATSIVLLTLDDIEFNANQCSLLMGKDYVLIHTLLLGASLRAGSNRWTEPRPNAFLSALTIARMNVTAHNVGTHCIVAVGPLNLKIDQPNVVLTAPASDKDPCQRATDLITKALGG